MDMDGRNTFQVVREYERESRKLANYKIPLWLNLRCKESRLVPRVCGFKLQSGNTELSRSDGVVQNQLDTGPDCWLCVRVEQQVRVSGLLTGGLPKLPSWGTPLITDLWWGGLAHSLCSNSSQKCSVGLRSLFCIGQSCSTTTDLLINVFIDFALCTHCKFLVA